MVLPLLDHLFFDFRFCLDMDMDRARPLLHLLLWCAPCHQNDIHVYP
jgi:hypothetical protein